MLAGEARTFFLTNFCYDMSFYDVCWFMLAEYNANPRQIRVRRTLQALLIDRLMTEH